MIAAHRQPPPPRLEWAYFLDVDGTLIDIAATPDAARVDLPLLALVQQLHRASDGALALVSGRTLADLERRLGGLAVPVAGQHGMERRDANGDLHCHGAAAPATRDIRVRLAPVLARHPDLLLEDKGLSLALHYRQAPQLAGYVHRLLGKLVSEAGDGLLLQRGKRVLEVKPAGCDKGTAIEDYLGEMPFRGRRPVFIGDDVTDEHGFEVVNRLDGISIKVGAGRSCARYRLTDVGTVRQWLAAAIGEHA
ncbi:MAG: trehalose-phosphatase [Rhodocyclales bacterium]|nr:trehalose-phosphatase [Rhodocyclales bacterium]